MAEFTLELITSQNEAYDAGFFITLELKNHVHHRVERFAYLDDVKSPAVPLYYIENEEMDAWNNLQVANRTYMVPANSSKFIEKRAGWSGSTSTSYSSEYKDVLITDQYFVDEKGNTRPLFWMHQLPENVVSCSLEIVSNGNRHEADTGYTVDLDTSKIYTNYQNYFNEDTGAYKLHFIICTDTAGTSTRTLLNPVPVVQEATWEDIDLDTGMLKTDVVLYTRERNTSGYTFYFNKGARWFVKPLEKSLIQPKLPSAKDAEDNWYLRFTNGDVSTLVNASMRRYYLPEYDSQNFAPYKPYIYSPYDRVLWVNKHVVMTTRRSLKVDTEIGLHVTVFVSDYENNLLRVLTTNQVLDGKRYSNTDVFYEADKIAGWDNEGGFIALGIKLHPSWQFAAQYYYESSDFEYTAINLNPLYNKTIKDKLVVFYMVPNADMDDSAIHHLIVDQVGQITYCSQSLGFSYPNLQLLDSSGNYNSSTVIGMKYISDLEIDTFTTNYVAGYDNTNAYSIIAEVSILDRGLETDQYTYNVMRDGSVLAPETEEEALKANPRILQSEVYYTEDGQPVPKQAVIVIKAPLSILEDYGGNLSQSRAELLLTQHLDSAVYPVISWDWPQVELVVQSTEAGIVNLSWTYEGDYTYNLYRAVNELGEWELVTSVASPSEGNISYTDTDVESDSTVYYEVRIQEGSIEYPAGFHTSVRVV